MASPVRWILNIFILFGLFGFSASMPLRPDDDTNHTNALIPRQCQWNSETYQHDCNDYLPSLNQLKQRMWDTASGGKVTPEARAVFWTNLLDSDTPEAHDDMYAMIAQQMEHRGIDNFYFDRTADTSDWFTAQEDAIRNYGTQMKPQHPIFNAEDSLKVCWSQALAEAALHEDAYLFTKDDEAIRDNSLWAAAEYPALTQEGGAVNRIYRIDPRPIGPQEGSLGECRPPELLWERGKDAPIPFPFNGAFKCTVLTDHP